METIKSIQKVTGKKLFSILGYDYQTKEPVYSEIVTDTTFTLVDTTYGYLILDEEEGILLHDSTSIVIVLKNQDFTSGNGPMLYHKAFESLKDAIDYVMQQGGIYGSPQRINNHCGINIMGTPYCVSWFNGYKIKIDILH